MGGDSGAGWLFRPWPARIEARRGNAEGASDAAERQWRGEVGEGLAFIGPAPAWSHIESFRAAKAAPSPRGTALAPLETSGPLIPSIQSKVTSKVRGSQMGVLIQRLYEDF